MQAGATWTYLDIEVLVHLDSVAEQRDVLRQICELPHVPQLVQCAGLFDGLLHLHLIARALSCRHRQGACQRSTRLGFLLAARAAGGGVEGDGAENGEAARSGGCAARCVGRDEGECGSHDDEDEARPNCGDLGGKAEKGKAYKWA